MMSNKYATIKALTQWTEKTPIDFYISVKSKDYSAKWTQINRCSICMCEIFDDIEIDEEQEDKNPKAAHETLMGKLITFQKTLLADIDSKFKSD